MDKVHNLKGLFTSESPMLPSEMLMSKKVQPDLVLDNAQIFPAFWLGDHARNACHPSILKISSISFHCVQCMLERPPTSSQQRIMTYILETTCRSYRGGPFSNCGRVWRITFCVDLVNMFSFSLLHISCYLLGILGYAGCITNT